MRVLSGYGQTREPSYVQTLTPQSATDGVNESELVAKSLVTYQYYDGFSRPVQTVRKGVSAGNKDLVSYQEYDGAGRQGRSWLPVPYGGNGSFVPESQLKTEAVGFYKDSYPYSEPVYEDSPLDRLSVRYGPGQEWRNAGKGVKTEYMTNTSVAGDVLSCYHVGVRKSDGSIENRLYPSGSLVVEKITDESGQVRYVFTDKEGREVLTRIVDGTEYYNTTKGYDEDGNLLYVFTPGDPLLPDKMGSLSWASPHLKKMSYNYQYDHRNRMIRKHIPSCGNVTMAYDKNDRLILSRDEEQRSAGKWSFTLYDAFDRPVVSGEGKGADSLYVVNHVITAKYNASVNWQGTGYETNLSLTDVSLHAVYYYDHYGFLDLPACAPHKDSLLYTGNPEEKHTLLIGGKDYSAKDKVSGKRVFLLDESGQENITSVYYNPRGGISQSRSTNHLGGYEIETTDYTYTGLESQRRVQSSTSGSGSGLTETYTTTYNQLQQPTLISYTNGKVSCYLGSSYNAVGQLTGNSGITATCSYTYNIRGWRTRASNYPGYSEQITYDYGGNVTGLKGSVYLSGVYDQPEMNWEYKYNYDGLNRLKTTVAVSGGHTEALTYDKNGNIMTLKRISNLNNPQVIDDLTYTYEGNQVKRITDKSTATSDYHLYQFTENKQQTGAHYRYNKNGCMTYNANANIDSVEYNSLGLPYRVKTKSSTSQFAYDGEGKKLRVGSVTGKSLVYAPVTSLSTRGVDTRSVSYSKDYIGNKEYVNGRLSRIDVPGGYIKVSGATHKVYGYQKDYLGSNRVVLDAANSSNVVQYMRYYPFGLQQRECYWKELQPYKYSGKEYISFGGLECSDFGARLYDQSIGRWMCPDPLAEKYYSVSPYVYCMNNPMRYVDPDGMDIYMLTSDGRTILALKTDDKYDRLYNSYTDVYGYTSISGKYIDVMDKGLLPQLTNSNNFLTAETINSNDAFNVFKFVVDNSSVEWGLSGYKNKGNINYVINSDLIEDNVTLNTMGHERKDMTFHIHSHPGGDETKKASGYELYKNGIKFGSSDAEFMNSQFNIAKKANKKWPKEYPTLYIYHKESGGIYNYDHMNSSKYVGKALTYKMMKSLIMNHKMNIK
ncbi:DUF6443 domain-containing protein [Coprobacter tertius]|uniref:DUF6443 domain-containing protein n=1 Tax=Coprobacter tertius TaxID=2944915 RepID=A0ABT1MCZ8_9BACT|nr:DUF6443 domain-containing protein [Coprobacter tertius]MCP9610512.1 DUF6443 domain-containing protein [Coprobacter tertius]